MSKTIPYNRPFNDDHEVDVFMFATDMFEGLRKDGMGPYEATDPEAHASLAADVALVAALRKRLEEI